MLKLSDAEFKAEQPTFFWSDDFAVLLDHKRSIDPKREVHNELERHHLFGALYLRRNLLESQEQQDIVWDRFCALYLPLTISRFIKLPPFTAPNAEVVEDFPLRNAWFEMLVAVQHSPYFSKYLRSTKPIAADGKLLASALAKRLVAVAPRWDMQMRNPPTNMAPDYYTSAAGSAIQLLSLVTTTYLKEPDQDSVVPKATREQLVPWLSTWMKRYNNQFLGDVSKRVWISLSGNLSPSIYGDSSMQKEYLRVRKLFNNALNCGVPGCENTKDLKACGKCGTVRYCSTEHQRLHWTYPVGAQHKQLCHKTEY